MTAAETILFEECVAFLKTIGIPVVFTSIDAPCFLPGFRLQNGTVLVDKDKMLYPGDLLHEAAHLAIVPAADRQTLLAESIMHRPQREAEEMMAIAWSYAACVHLNIDPYFVFHDNGYDGGGKEIADNFREGRYFGVPMLQWTGMCATANSTPAYPAMLHWLRGDK
jgi:hypothetical protein